jgi:hypothetical protein
MWTSPVHNPGRRGGVMSLGSDFPGPGSLTWRPRRELLAVGCAAVVAVVAWVLLLATDPMDRVVGVVIAAIVAAATVWAWRRRLLGGPRGLLIGGVGGARLVPWSQVRGLDAARSQRLGIASTTIEIDLMDDDLLVFGRTDLGADPIEVLAALRAFSPLG